MDLSRAFNDNWQHKQFPVRQQRLLLAASGGIDSMVLASLLYASGFNFIVAHCNFQLRGMESDEDERLVSEWARQHGVIFRQVRFETRATAATWRTINSERE